MASGLLTGLASYYVFGTNEQTAQIIGISTAMGATWLSMLYYFKR